MLTTTRHNQLTSLMFHDHTCNYYLVNFSDMTLQRPGDAEEMQSLIICKIHVFWGNTKSMTNSCTQSYNKLYMGFWCAISSQYDESCVSVKQLNLHDCIIIWSPVNINTFCALCSDNSAKALHSSFQEKNTSWQPRCTTYVVPNQANTEKYYNFDRKIKSAVRRSIYKSISFTIILKWILL